MLNDWLYASSYLGLFVLLVIASLAMCYSSTDKKKTIRCRTFIVLGVYGWMLLSLRVFMVYYAGADDIPPISLIGLSMVASSVILREIAEEMPKIRRLLRPFRKPLRDEHEGMSNAR